MQQDRTHALEHVRGGQRERDHLQPARQHRDRVVNAAEWEQQKGKRPGELLRAKPVAQDDACRDQAERPARQNQHGEEGDERQAEIEQIEAEQEISSRRHRNHAHAEADHAPDAQRYDEFIRTERARQQIAEIARPHLLDEGGGETDIRAEQNVPQQDRADEHAGSLRHWVGGAREIFLEEAPGQHLEGLYTQRQCPSVAHDALRAEDSSASSRVRFARRRTTSRNTSSKVFRPKVAISVLGVSSSMMRPASSRMTRSASRSTSVILWEASSNVAPRDRA